MVSGPVVSRHVVSLTFGLLDTWTFGHLVFGTNELLDIWPFWHLAFWTLELFDLCSLDFWSHDFWPFGHLDFWTFDLLDIWSFGRLNFWTFGLLDIWSSWHLDFLSASYSCSRFYIFKILLFLFFFQKFSQIGKFYSSGTILFFWNNFILLE